MFLMSFNLISQVNVNEVLRKSEICNLVGYGVSNLANNENKAKISGFISSVGVGGLLIDWSALNSPKIRTEIINNGLSGLIGGLRVVIFINTKKKVYNIEN